MLRLGHSLTLGFATLRELDALPLEPVGDGSSRTIEGGRSRVPIAKLEAMDK